MSTTRTAPLRRVLASVLTGALIASAAVLGIAAPANAADLSMAVPEVPRAGGTVTIEGSGYLADSTGVYLSVRDEGAATDVNTVWIAVGNTVGVIPGVGGTAPMNADGSFSVQIDVPAFTEGTSYVLHTRRAHGQPEPDPNQLASVAVLYEAAPAVATSTTLATTPGGTIVEGTSVTLTATVSPAEAAGTVTFRNGSTALGTASASDGTATFSTDALPVGMASLAADFAATDAAAYTGSTSGVVSLEVTATPIDPPLPVPAVTVSSTSGLDPAGETITVTGTGFMPNPPATNGANRPPLLGAFAGAYVAFGSYLDMWRPSEGAPSAARQNHDVRWGVHEAQLATIGGGAAGGIVIEPDGTFETTLTVSEAADVLTDSNFGIYTYAGGGAVYAPFETFTPITFAEPLPVPTITVTPHADLDPNIANTLTITGTGYTGPGAVLGAYVLFGEASLWSGESPLPGEGWISQAWVQPAQIVDGSFETTLTIPAGTLDPESAYQVATSAAHRLSVTDRSLDAFAPVTVAGVTPMEPQLFLNSDSVQQGGSLEVRGTGFPSGELATVMVNSDPITLGSALVGASGVFTVAGVVPATFAVGSHTVVATAGSVTLTAPLTVTAAAATPTPEQPEQPTCVARAVSGASIQWSVKESFRNYIQGPIANGSYSINWGSGAGTFSTETDRGRVSYGGAAHLTGHSGALDLTISNPRIQVNSTGSATLIVNVQSKGFNGSPDVNSSGVAFASLSLPGASETANRISWSGASATLTAAGAQAFAGFYNAGDALDPVSFSFPLGDEVPCDSTTDGSLAATGGDAPVDIMWLGLGMLVLGAGVYVLRRRSVRA